MKRQYLGDSRDSFKWDYHHHLAVELGAPELQVVWMMTPDDRTGEGRTSPDRFPARPEVIRFCHDLRESRDPALASRLPSALGASYGVRLHGSDRIFSMRDRAAYFAAIEPSGGLVFLDPDNGFEPEKSCTEKHVGYAEIDGLLKRASPSTVISVFHYHRRVSFPDDFARIRERLVSGHATALYWHALMFVALTTTRETRDRVREANRAYAAARPVRVLA